MHRSKKASLLDHLVSELLQLQRHVEAERLGGLHVDDEPVFGRRLHRQITRLRPLEDSIDVSCCLSVLVVYKIRAVVHQTALLSEIVSWRDGRQAIATCQVRDQALVQTREAVALHQQSAVRLTREQGQGGFNVSSSPDRRSSQL